MQIDIIRVHLSWLALNPLLHINECNLFLPWYSWQFDQQLVTPMYNCTVNKMQHNPIISSISSMVDGRCQVLITRLLCHTLFQYDVWVCLINKNWNGIWWRFHHIVLQSQLFRKCSYYCIVIIFISLSIVLQYILMCSMCVCDMVLDTCFSIFKQWNIHRCFSGLKYWILNYK